MAEPGLPLLCMYAAVCVRIRGVAWLTPKIDHKSLCHFNLVFQKLDTQVSSKCVEINLPNVQKSSKTEGEISLKLERPI